MSETPPLKRASYVLHVSSVAGFHELQSHRSASLEKVRLDAVRPLDEVLDLFDDEPRFQHFTLDGETFWLEEYLSIRPENFERVEAAVQAGQLLIGPWYIQPDPKADPELLIRNLLIGLRTARVFGRPMLVGYLPHWRDVPGQIPQILKGFGINSVIVGHIEAESLEVLCTGIDGTQITVSQLRSPEHERLVPNSLEEDRGYLAPYSQSGHLLLLRAWDMHLSHEQRLAILQALPAAQMALHDDVFHSNPVAYSKAVQASREPLPELVLSAAVTDNEQSEWNEIQILELLSVWVDALEPRPDDQHLRQPQTLIQTLWKEVLHKQSLSTELGKSIRGLAKLALADLAQRVNTALLPDSTYAQIVFNPSHKRAVKTFPGFGHTPVEIPPFGYVSFALRHDSSGSNINRKYTAPVRLRTADTDIHEGPLPLSASIISVSEAGFHLSTVKLPEDAERGGMIVRGTTLSTEAIWVTLTPWRPFATVEVLTLDESPTGGKLAPEAEGAVRFYARPHGILTLWFHD